MEPIIVQSLFESIEILKNGMTTLINGCINDITPNKEYCRNMVENSIGLVTALNPILGYEVCTQLAKEALESNRGVLELVLEKKLLRIFIINCVLVMYLKFQLWKNTLQVFFSIRDL